MANPQVRAIPIYYQNKKIAEAYDTQFKLAGGRQPVFGAEGLATHSRGAVITGITVGFFVPVQGVSVPVFLDIINQKDVTMRLPIGGKMFEIDMAPIDVDVKSNTETGKCDGSANFSGGKPKVLG